MPPFVLVLFGIIINGIGTLSYLRDTLKGKIKPNKVTFLIWSIAPFVAYVAQITKGVGIQSLMTLSVSIFPLSIFFASFVHKNAHWKILQRDIVCGALSVLGLLTWYITKEANYAIVFSLFSEAFATLPTILKSYSYPETESGWPWLASTMSGILTLITISNWNFATFAFPLFYTVEMVAIFILVQYKLGKK